ncbi:MAG: hypothetical protein QXG00_04345 [Candidatus Woesearchaeota archaeon]
MSILKIKRAYAFTLDAFIAAGIIITGLLLISSLVSYHDKTEQLDYLSKDLLQSLSEIKIYEIQTTIPFVQKKIADGNITNTNNSVLVQIGEFWATNHKAMATELASLIIDNIIPEGYGVNLTIGEDTIYERSKKEKNSLISSRRMISGIEEGKPLTGSTSSGYLKRVRDKPNSEYIYFGGFVGQGNITRFITLHNITVINMQMELDAAGPFMLKINGIQCNTNGGSPIFTPITANMTPDIWNISHCKSFIYPGRNNFVLIFEDINTAYIAGGYIKIDYLINQFQETPFETTARTYLPGISGIVNLFDSFYVPGSLNNLSIYLHYNVNTSKFNNTFYLTIGNETLFYDNTTTNETTIILTDANFSRLNYSLFNASTIPIRIGFENISVQQLIRGGEGFGDIVVTTDVSGSMAWRFDTNSVPGTSRSCSDPNLYDGSTRRMNISICVNKIFVNQVLSNTTLNRIGLVSYSSSTQSTENLTNKLQILESRINSYQPSGATCTSCGIASAWNLLKDPPPAKLHKDKWKFSQDYQFSDPPNNWMNLTFNDESWSEGDAPFGYNNPVITIILNYNNSLYNSPVNLWEYQPGDLVGPPNDFSSGQLNSTGNTWGLLAGDDGWDFNSSGIYGSTSTAVNVYTSPQWRNDYELRVDIGGTNIRQSSAGGFGIQINITPELYNIILSGGYAVASFRWSWDENDNFEPEDQVSIKATFTNSSGRYYLGTFNDSLQSGGDPEPDVWAKDDPDGDSWDNLFTEDITKYITQPGYYYFDFGGKLRRDSNSESGVFWFDDVSIIIANKTGNTYYRNKFTINDLSRFSDAKLYIASDNRTEVYLNGILIDNDLNNHQYAYWNRNGLSIPISNFIEGENILAVKLYNNDTDSGYFDLELRANMSGRQKALIIMTDGDANVCINDWSGGSGSCNRAMCNNRACCPNETTGVLNVQCPDLADIGTSGDGEENAFEQVINISCYLHNYYNVSIYTVAFGIGTSLYATRMLNKSASCDNSSHFYLANNVSGLADIYQDIADSILNSFSTRESQIIIVSGGNYEESILYPDSYIEYNYTPLVNSPDVNEIELVIETPKFNNCTPVVDIPGGVRVIDSKIVSYSGQHWTDFVSINGVEVYNLSKYDNESYIRLGDPFIVQIPPTNLLIPGQNYLNLRIGDSPLVSTNCSTNNSFIYTILVNSSTSRSTVLPSKEGCNWTIESEDFVNKTFSIPTSYSGNRQCNFTNMSHVNSYDPNNAYDVSVYEILRQLDFDNDGRIIVNLEQEDLEVIVLLVSGLPYQWGPSVIEAKVWH